MSCFIRAIADLPSGAVRKRDFAFSTGKGDRRKLHMRNAIGSNAPIGIAQFLPIEDIEEYVDEMDALRLNVSWGNIDGEDGWLDPCMGRPVEIPVPPDAAVSVVSSRLHHTFRKLHQKRQSRNLEDCLGQLREACILIGEREPDPAEWDPPKGIEGPVEESLRLWEVYTSKQNDIRAFVSEKSDRLSQACEQREIAREDFCISAETVLSDSSLQDLIAKDPPVLPNLEAKFREKRSEKGFIDSIQAGLDSIHNWAPQGDVFQKKYAEATNATDAIAQRLKNAIFLPG